MNVIPFMGYKIFSDDLYGVSLEKKKIINTISPQCYGFAKKDSEYKKALINSDLIILDSYYFGLLAFIINKTIIKRYYGYDVFQLFMNKINAHKGRVYFLGSNSNVIEAIKNKAKIVYPDVVVDGYAPPFKDVFTFDENNIMIKSINDFKPDILFVGMSAPKQEKWVEYHKEVIDANIICSIGAVFEWFAGTQKKISPIWFKIGLGWLMRLMQRPVLIKRMPYIMMFFVDALLVLMKIKKIDVYENN